MLAGGVVQVNLIIGRQVASFFDGAVAWLSYADRLYQLPLGVVGIAVGVGAVFWLPPFLDQLFRDPGNIRMIVEHFLGEPTDLGVYRGQRGRMEMDVHVTGVGAAWFRVHAREPRLAARRPPSSSGDPGSGDVSVGCQPRPITSLR